MVGPLSTEEIEDVVSSVRRLVSNEQRPRPLSRDLNSERLLLTPALRVVSELGPLAPLILASPLADPAPGGLSPEPAVTDQGPDLPVPPDPESVWAETMADTVLVEAEWEEDIWAEAEPPLAEAALMAEEAQLLAEAAAMPPAEAVPTPEPEPEPTWSASGAIPFVPLRRRAEALAARLAGPSQPEMPDHAADGAAVSDPGTVSAQGSGQEAGGDETQAFVAALVASEAAEPEAGPPEAQGSGGNRVIEPEAEILDTDDDPGPAVFDAAVAAAMAEEGRAQRVPTELIDADGTPIAVLDESALAEIVRLMIREELQGELGERVTRSVRKLVRAEINRALIARDLD